jgi:DNA-binding NarL/FixJ family response regulator
MDIFGMNQDKPDIGGTMVGSITSTTQKNPARGQKSQLSVWVIDDNRDFSAAFSKYIETITEFQCTRCFDSVESALATLDHETSSPDVILLNIEMPGMNGLEAIVPLKQAAPKSRITMVTSKDSAWHKRAALDKGADGYFVKLDITKEKLTEILGLAGSGTAFKTGTNQIT